MYDESIIGLSEARKAVQVILDQAMKKPDQPVAIAVVDNGGRLVEFARMDHCKLIPQQLAFKKAYTSAIMRSDSKLVGESFKSMGRSLSELGDPNFIGFQGAVVIERPSDRVFLGAIGVSGLTAAEDEALARLGVQAMGYETSNRSWTSNAN